MGMGQRLKTLPFAEEVFNVNMGNLSAQAQSPSRNKSQRDVDCKRGQDVPS